MSADVISHSFPKFATTERMKDFDRRHRGSVVAEMVGEQRQRELARLRALVAPLKSIPGELPHLQARIERAAVDGHLDTVDGSISQIVFHAVLPSLQVKSRSRYAAARLNECSPDGAQRNPGIAMRVRLTPEFRPLHPEYAIR